MGLMEDKNEYSSLNEKYQNFRVPAVKIKIGGTQIIGQSGIHIGQVQVKLSLRAAGSASFTLHSAYDYKNSSFSSAVKSRAVPGKIVEVELGYGSKTTLVFKGFIASVGIQFDMEDGISFQITALDARRLMMTDNKPYLEYRGSEYSAYTKIVEKIMKRYSALCRLKCEGISGDSLDKDAAVCQKESDYDFIVGSLIGTGKVDGEFFIVADQAYFRKPGANKTPMITLGIGSGLKSFERTAVYLNRTIEVQGYDPDKQNGQGKDNPVLGTALAVSPDSQDKVIEAGVSVFAEADCRDAQTARAMAQKRAEDLRSENCQAGGSCIGLPEIVPGRYLQIQGVDVLVNRKYYVTEVSHSINGGGFSTSFSTEGWE